MSIPDTVEGWKVSFRVRGIASVEWGRGIEAWTTSCSSVIVTGNVVDAARQYAQAGQTHVSTTYPGPYPRLRPLSAVSHDTARW